MEIKKVTGIVLNSHDYSESSRIINVSTKEHGIIGMMAKGAKRPKNSLSSVTNPLIYGEFNIYYKEGKLSTLISVDVINNFKNIMKDITLISYATFITELTGQVLKHDNDAELFDIFANSLIKIDQGLNPKVITNIVELKYLSFLGIMPILEECAICGDKTNIVALSSYKGGYLCNECAEGETNSEKAIKLIRMFNLVNLETITKLEVKDNVQKEIDNFINDYYDRYSGLYLYSKKLLDNLSDFQNWL